DGNAHEPALEDMKRRQREDKKAYVAVELWVLDAEGPAIQPAEDSVPFGGGDRAEDNGKKEGAGDESEKTKPAKGGYLGRRHSSRLAPQGGPARDPDVSTEVDEEDGGAAEKEPDAGDELLGVDRLESDALEPKPVDVEVAENTE